MATLHATRILEALQKARRVGRVEESVTIDGCSLVLSNLSSDDYVDVESEVSDLEEAEYLTAFLSGHICRSIVEIGGQDLRAVDFIEDAVPSGRVLLSASLSKVLAERVLEEIRKGGGEGSIEADGETRMVKLERHEWIRTRVLSTWSREAIQVAWRKFSEVVALAEEKTKEGIQFRIPDESSEERFRRLIGEMKEVEETLPSELVRTILDEAGYQSKSSAEELEAVEQRMRRVAVEQEAKSAPAPVQSTVPAPAPVQAQPTPEEMMQRRQPLNRQPVAVPAPRQTQVEAARPEKAEVPKQLRQSAQQNVSSLSRSAKIAALEGAVDPGIGQEIGMPIPRLPEDDEVAELTEQRGGVDGEAVVGITDQPPMVGINPRFRPPPRG